MQNGIMKNFFSEKFCIFDRADLFPRENLKEAITIFMAWALPAFLFVVWADKYYPDVKFYQAAITEGIGPNLWNTIGSFGLFTFGVAVSLSSFFTPSLIARQILENTYAIGCLTFGLLVGQWCLLPFSELTWWQQGLFGVTSVFLLVVVFLYNMVVWCLSSLIQNSPERKSNFLVKLEKMHWVWRAGIGLSISCVALLAFLSV
ncbi:MAG: hypothetical protein VX595_12975 [Pseudomonadota bacterium]|nr:hypothetical protein [Pseudomonadota bacterium]